MKRLFALLLLLLPVVAFAEDKEGVMLGGVPSPPVGNSFVLGSDGKGDLEWKQVGGGIGRCVFDEPHDGAYILNCPGFAPVNNPMFTGTVSLAPGSSLHIDGNLNIGTEGSLTFNNIPVGGACVEGEFVSAISKTLVPSCSAPVGGGGSIFTGPTPPTNPTVGTPWYDSSVTPPVLKIWDGTAWITVSSSNTTTGPTPPTNPAIGDLWSDTTTTPPTLRIWDGTRWVAAHAGVMESPTFEGTVTMPDGTTWDSTGISSLTVKGEVSAHSLELPIGGTITIGGQPFTSGVTSFNGRTGAVALTVGDITALGFEHGGPFLPLAGGAYPFDPQGTVTGDVAITKTLYVGDYLDFDLGPHVFFNPVLIELGNPPTHTGYLFEIHMWGSPLLSFRPDGNLWAYGDVTIGGKYLGWDYTFFPRTSAPSTTGISSALYYDSTLRALRAYANGAWYSIAPPVSGSGATAPTGPQTGQLWFDTSTGQLKVWNGTAWAIAGGIVGGTCSGSDFINAISPTGVPSCATPSGGGSTLPTPVSIANGGTGGGTAPTIGQVLIATSATTFAPANPPWAPINNPTFTGTVTLPAGTTINNPTFTGTVALPNASVTDTMLANSYSGVGTCTAGQFVNALNRNTAPTCAAPPSATGFLPVNNPTFTGVMTGPRYVLNNTYGDSIKWYSGLGYIANIGMGGGFSGTNSAAFALNLSSNMAFIGGSPNPWTATSSYQTASSIQLYGPAIVITGNTGLVQDQTFVPHALFSISPVAYGQDSKHSDVDIPVGARFRVPVILNGNAVAALEAVPLQQVQSLIAAGGGGASTEIGSTAPNSPKEGQLWFNTVDLQTYIRWGNIWVVAINQASPKGDKGDKGDTGERGEQGERGEKGETGPPSIPAKNEEAPLMLSATNGTPSLTGDAPTLLRIGKSVFLSYTGANKSSSTANTISLFWIPVGYRPTGSITQAIQTPSANITISVATSGTNVFPANPGTNVTTANTNYVGRASASLTSNAAVAINMHWHTTDPMP